MNNYNFRNITEEDYEFIYELKKNAYKKYVERLKKYTQIIDLKVLWWYYLGIE
mgnify:CR=1 FL=1